MGYPIILCGDQFEAKEVEQPLSSFDARDWAAAFCKVANGFKDAEGKSIEEDWMVTWFANALMRGYDECTADNT